MNAVKVCFSSINLYKISAVDSVVYKHAIGQVKTKDIFTFQKFEGNAEIDSIVIRGFADTTWLNDSLNKELANKRAHFLHQKYRKQFPNSKIIIKSSQVLPGGENRKTVVIIYRKLLF
jgi:hypothetical protein